MVGDTLAIRHKRFSHDADDNGITLQLCDADLIEDELLHALTVLVNLPEIVVF
jgi:hypothetical protein